MPKHLGKNGCGGDLEILFEGTRFYVCACRKCKGTVSVEKLRFSQEEIDRWKKSIEV